MGTITISVDDQTENRFRKRVLQVHGERKGALGKAVTEAMDLWMAQKAQEELAERAILLMDSGYDLGTRNYRTRADLHERGNGTR